jgi:hypothetical protein
MALTVPNEGEVQILNTLTRKVAPTDLLLDLFSSNTNPSNASVYADFTLCTGGGYAQKTLANTAWTVTAGAPTVANTAAQAFTWTSVPAVTNVFGYLVHTNSKIIAAERLPVAVAPFVISAPGESVTITPQITCGSTTND